MLQNLKEDFKKAKHYRKILRRCRPEIPREQKHLIKTSQFRQRLSKYVPTGIEYTEDTEHNFTGCFVDPEMNFSKKLDSINSYSRSKSIPVNQSLIDHGLCDNASQAIEYYRSKFVHDDPESHALVDKPAEEFRKYHHGNHVIILHPISMLNQNPKFSWTKWCTYKYLGSFDAEDKYAPEIAMVYYFEIIKVR